jgi:hypothetical protein
MASHKRLDGGVADMVRGGEVRFTDLQVNDRPPGGFQRLGAGQQLEGGFRAEPSHPFRKLETRHGTDHSFADVASPYANAYMEH